MRRKRHLRLRLNRWRGRHADGTKHQWRMVRGKWPSPHEYDHCDCYPVRCTICHKDAINYGKHWDGINYGGSDEQR